MRILGWIYRLVVNLIILAIAYALIASARTQFETIVVCSLVLIYNAIGWAHTSLSIRFSSAERVNYARYLELRTLAGQPTQADEREQLSTLSKQIDEPGAAFFIDVAGISIMSVWATLQLVLAVVHGTDSN